MPTSNDEVFTNITLYTDDMDNYPVYVGAKQYDQNTRYIKATIRSKAGLINMYGSIVQLNAIKPNGTRVYVIGDISPDGLVTIGISGHLLEFPGKIPCDISFFDSSDVDERNELLTTMTFYLMVEKSNFDPDAEEGDIDIEGDVSIVTRIVDKEINEHNEDSEAHNDIRQDIISLQNADVSMGEDIAGLGSTVGRLADDVEDLKSAVEDLPTAEEVSSGITSAIATHNQSEQAHQNLRDAIAGIAYYAKNKGFQIEEVEEVAPGSGTYVFTVESSKTHIITADEPSSVNIQIPGEPEGSAGSDIEYETRVIFKSGATAPSMSIYILGPLFDTLWANDDVLSVEPNKIYELSIIVRFADYPEATTAYVTYNAYTQPEEVIEE